MVLAVATSVLSAVGAERNRIRRHHVVKHHWILQFQEPRRERMFLAATSFLITFSLARIITHSVRRGAGLKNFTIGGSHVHHLVFGIGILHVTGYVFLMALENLVTRPWAHRAAAIGYGAGAAMTLDEFALWLRLEDVYWTQDGRKSIDAVAIFGALLLTSVWGGNFVKGVARDLIWVRDFERRHWAAHHHAHSQNGSAGPGPAAGAPLVAEPAALSPQ